MNALLAASATFFLLHSVPATPLRARFVAAFPQLYAAIFSLASAGAIWWMVHAFNAAPYGEKLWTMPETWLWLKAGLVFFAYVLIVCGVITPNPSAPGGDKVLAKRDAAEGIYAITRHPLMWGIAIWAIAHMISMPNARGLVFFGGFAATALIGSWLQQRRKRWEVAGWGAFEAKTSYWPFWAIFEGRAKFSFAAIGWGRLAIAAALWALILHFHLSWFGVQPLPVQV
jgi:uncharacterized membrane protein